MPNLVIVVFLSLKNTPLAILTASSYERLNIFHRLSGYVTIGFVILHACTYATLFTGQGMGARLIQGDEIYGIVGAASFLILGFAGAIIRSWWYELFYYVHVVFWILAIVMTGLHQPEPAKKILTVTCVAAGIWCIDRLIRLARLVLYSSNNSVQIFPLPNGGTRVILAKPPRGAASGKHGFLWVPAIRAFETHPFTIAATNPLEFVVSAHDGFTRALHKYATREPGCLLKASVEGPYGAFPNPVEYDKVVLVAGGSGASFTVGAALRTLNKLREDEAKEIQFIWMIKNQTYTTWYTNHLKTLSRDFRVSVRVFVTRASQPETLRISPPSTLSPRSPAEPSSPDSIIPSDQEKETLSRLTIPQSISSDLEKEGFSSPIEELASPTLEIEIGSDIPILYGRPDVKSLIQTAIDDMTPDKRVLIMSCGPKTLITAVRNATAECVRVDGPGVELHCEQFEW